MGPDPLGGRCPGKSLVFRECRAPGSREHLLDVGEGRCLLDRCAVDPRGSLVPLPCSWLVVMSPCWSSPGVSTHLCCMAVSDGDTPRLAVGLPPAPVVSFGAPFGLCCGFAEPHWILLVFFGRLSYFECPPNPTPLAGEEAEEVVSELRCSAAAGAIGFVPSCPQSPGWPLRGGTEAGGMPWRRHVLTQEACAGGWGDDSRRGRSRAGPTCFCAGKYPHRDLFQGQKVRNGPKSLCRRGSKFPVGDGELVRRGRDGSGDDHHHSPTPCLAWRALGCWWWEMSESGLGGC